MALLEFPDVTSFEKTYKTAYSHGLEKIYALENIDIRSVRKITEIPPSTIAEMTETSPDHWIEAPQSQLELKLGLEFQKSIPPFILREPIMVLRLPKNVEKCLLEQGKSVLQHLLEPDFKTLVALKSLGQGHIDDVHAKLKKYVAGKPLQETSRIDFSSWLRTLVADLEPKKTYIALEPFNLSYFVPLSPAENVEVKRLSKEVRQEWVLESEAKFRTENRLRQVYDDWGTIVTVFIKPWLKNRLGLATEGELLERLLSKSDSVPEAQLIISWLESIYFSDAFPLAKFLYPLDEKLFALDEDTVHRYAQIEQKARSYFYKADVYYSLPQLIGLISREYAKIWHGFTEEFIARALRLSPHFRVRKDDSGQLVVRLS